MTVQIRRSRRRKALEGGLRPNLGPSIDFAIAGSLLAGVLLVGCDGGTDAVDSGRTASVGPLTVQHQGIPSSLPFWRIDETPAVRIGALDTPGPELFGTVRGVSEGADGSIRVAEGYSNQLRVFDHNGRHLWTSGGEGDGPGEYRGIKSVFSFRSDSLLVVQLASPVASVLDSQGRFGRKITFDRPRPGFSMPFVLGVLPSGSVVAFSEEEFPVNGPEPGFRRARAAVALFDGEGRLLRELGTYRSGESMIEILERGFRVRRVRFGRQMVVAVGGGRVAVSDQERFLIDVYGPEGYLEMTVDVLTDLVPVNDAFRARYADASLEGIRDPAARRERASSLRGALLSDTLPAIGDLALDSQGRLWVQEYVPSFERHLPSWWVFARDGGLLAKTRFPEGFSPVQIGAEHVLGITRDSLDVQWVEVRKILRNATN